MSIMKKTKNKISAVLYSKISFWGDIYRSFLRYIDGETGRRLRYRYYKKRLKHLGKNVIIDTGVFITGAEYISIGDNTHIDKNCILVGAPSDLDLSYRILVELPNEDFKKEKGSITIGKECHISQNVMIYGYGGVDIGDYVALSTDTKVYSLTSLPFNPYDKSEVTTLMPFSGRSPTLIGAVVLDRNSWLGISCIVQPGITIKENAFVESNSVVSSSLNENVYAMGNPAKVKHRRFKV